MTTLVYSRKEHVIAVDSRCTMNGGVASNDSKKWIQKEDRLYFFCGDVADAEVLAELVDQGIDLLGEGETLDATVIYASNEPIVYYADGETIKHYSLHYDDFSAYGSGAFFALSALDFGKTAKQAVEYAMTRDIYSGGKVVQYDLTKQRFRK